MSNKMAVWPLVVDHFETLRDARTDKPRPQDFAWQLGVPLLLGVAAPLLGARLFDAGEVIAGMAVLAGLSFGLAVYVFQLRMEATRDPRVPRGDPLHDLLDE